MFYVSLYKDLWCIWCDKYPNQTIPQGQYWTRQQSGKKGNQGYLGSGNRLVENVEEAASFINEDDAETAVMKTRFGYEPWVATINPF